MTGFNSHAVSPGTRLAMIAPRRNRLTKTLGSGLLAKTGFPGHLAPLTFLHVIPIEAPCYAVRLGFANCYDLTMAISKASVYPSDSYGALADNNNAGLKDGVPATPYQVVPTGNAAGCRIYFDHEGADVGTISVGGTQRGLTLVADDMNVENKPKGFTIQWSDFAPCTSIPRADGGVQHLLFVYVTISSLSIAQGATAFFHETNADLVAHRGRHFWTGHAFDHRCRFCRQSDRIDIQSARNRAAVGHSVPHVQRRHSGRPEWRLADRGARKRPVQHAAASCCLGSVHARPADRNGEHGVGQHRACRL